MASNDNLGFNFGPTLGPIQIGGPIVLYKMEVLPPPPPPLTGLPDPDEGFLEDDPWRKHWGDPWFGGGGKGKGDPDAIVPDPSGTKKDSQGREIPPPPPPPPPPYQGGDFGDYDPEKGFVDVGGGRGGGYFGGTKFGGGGNFITPVKYRIPDLIDPPDPVRDPCVPIHPGDLNSNCPDIFVEGDEPYKIFDYKDGQVPSEWPLIEVCDTDWQNKIKSSWSVIFERDPDNGRFLSPWAMAYDAIKDKDNITLWECIINTACPEIGCSSCSRYIPIDTIVNNRPTLHYRDGAKYSGAGIRDLKSNSQVLYGICTSNIIYNKKWYSDHGVNDEQEILIHILLYILILRCNASSTLDGSLASYEALLLSSYEPSSGYGSFPWEAINRPNYYEINSVYRDKKGVQLRAPYLRQNALSDDKYPGRLKGRWSQWDPDTGNFYTQKGDVLIGSNLRWKMK
jgi:hypothetical protein